MQEAWLSRSFPFDHPVERVDVFLSRLRGTGPRIAAAVRGLPPATLTARHGDKWSIQEHVGHLHDLEALHLRRLDELAQGAKTLSAADMKNEATWNARHNERPFEQVFAAFETSRASLLQRLEALDGTNLAKSALHPRLQKPMRAVDIAAFTAEHDDHHVAALENLARTAPPAPAPRAVSTAWTALPHDAPMALLERRRVIGREAMISHVTLHAGCDVPVHEHVNEQFSCVLSGKVRFRLADGDRVVSAGEVLWLPSHAPHGAFALETAVVLDVFAPPSASTGIDARRS